MRRLCAAAALLVAALILYSQTRAFAWDEGFHLLAAQSIKNGRQPYIDFCFPQTPLNAYWNAAWMHIFGDTWRTAHALAALATGAAVFLTAQFVFLRWRLLGAIGAMALMGMNAMVFEYGTIGQAYGLCLLLIVGAFRSAIVAIDRASPLWAAGAGFLSVAAACSSLLTAPVAPILLIWIFIYGRWRKSFAFLAGGLIASIPIILLFIEGPRQTWFNIFEYHFLYRQLEWDGAIPHDLRVMALWTRDVQALILIFLALVGLWFVARRSAWDRVRKAEFYLCAVLAVAITAHIAGAHPNFPQYYLLVVPFLTILSIPAIYAIAPRVHPWISITIVTILVSFGLTKSLIARQDIYTWRDLEQIAAKVSQLTPAGAALMADDHIYFLTHHTPPSGLELEDSHKFHFPPDRTAYLHLLPWSQLEHQIRTGMFTTIETCYYDTYEPFGLPHPYRQQNEIEGCTILWDPEKSPF